MSRLPWLLRAPAASRAHKERCSDAVRVDRAGVVFVYDNRAVDPQMVVWAEAHLAEMTGGYNRFLQQLNSAGQWGVTDTDLGVCVALIRPMRDYILRTQEKIKQAGESASKGS